MTPLQTKCGRVRFYEPKTTGGYWRLEWQEHGRRKQTSGGRTQVTATRKAARILADLDRGSQPLGKTKVSEVLDAYLRWGAQVWAANQRNIATRELTKLWRPYTQLRCEQVDERILRGMLNACSTENVAKARRSDLRSFLRWGKGQDYFRPDQVALLDEYMYVPDKAPAKKPSRRPRGSTSAEGHGFITPDEVPLHRAVVALGDALQERLRYGKLLVELTAATGLRIGEVFALTVDHVRAEQRQLYVEWQVLAIRNDDGGRLALPKGGKRRRAVYPTVAATGFELSQALDARVAEVEAEHVAGKNQDRLLFPAPRGGYHWSTSFTNDHFTPAAEQAGWERLTWQEDGKARYQWKHTMHSLRHRFAHDGIEVWKFTPAELTAVGGWESIALVFERYYGQSADLLSQVFKKTAD